MMLTRIQKLVRNGNLDALQAELNHRPRMLDYLEQKRSLLSIAAEFGQIEIAKFLLSKGSRALHLKTASKLTPLSIAVRANHLDMIELFFHSGNLDLRKSKQWQLDIQFNIATLLSTKMCHPCLTLILKLCPIEYLESHRYNAMNPLLSQDTCSLLHVLSASGSLELVSILINRGWKNLDLRNHFGETALHYAVFKGYIDIIILLVQHGATLDTNYPIMYAKLKRRKSCAQIFRAIYTDYNIDLRFLDYDLPVPLTEVEILDLRHQMYFEISLVQKLCRILN